MKKKQEGKLVPAKKGTGLFMDEYNMLKKYIEDGSMDDCIQHKTDTYSKLHKKRKKKKTKYPIEDNPKIKIKEKSFPVTPKGHIILPLSEKIFVTIRKFKNVVVDIRKVIIILYYRYYYEQD